MDTQHQSVTIVTVNPERNDRYPRWAALVAGILQVMLGVVSVSCNIAAITYSLNQAYSGYGIFCGILWLIGGSFGITSSCGKSRGLLKMATMVSWTMVLSIVSAAFMVIYFPFALAQLTLADNWFYYYKEEGQAEVAVSWVQLVAGIAELVVAIVASALCCYASSCCAGPPVGSMNGVVQQYGMVQIQGAPAATIPPVNGIANQGAVQSSPSAPVARFDEPAYPVAPLPYTKADTRY